MGTNSQWRGKAPLSWAGKKGNEKWNEIDSKIISLCSAYTVYIMEQRDVSGRLFFVGLNLSPSSFALLSRRKKVFVENSCGAQKKILLLFQMIMFHNMGRRRRRRKRVGWTQIIMFEFPLLSTSYATPLCVIGLRTLFFYWSGAEGNSQFLGFFYNQAFSTKRKRKGGVRKRNKVEQTSKAFDHDLFAGKSCELWINHPWLHTKMDQQFVNNVVSSRKKLFWNVARVVVTVVAGWAQWLIIDGYKNEKILQADARWEHKHLLMATMSENCDKIYSL